MYVAATATKSQKRLWLVEHRVTRGVRVPDLARALGIDRTAVYKLEKHWERVTALQQRIYAETLQIEPEALWSRPGGIFKGAKLIGSRIANLSEADLDRLAERIRTRSPKDH